jgi:selenocysteine-specific elongation factor
MSVVGTAGHVDHGKSTLLQALTGRDPDRWEEEKRRGLTIDLGFVWVTLPSGREVSFVDVPGHERFIKNMLAGIEAIDVALLVVAADEGWMPQSEEHLAVLDLLGVERAVVALTKVDRVEEDLVELATLEVIERLEGTGLEGSPIIPVSAVTGSGVDRIAAALDEALPELPEGNEPRLWIDRRFSVAGAGTVVTGTLLGGPLTVGDVLSVYPGGETVRIRTIESHERAAERVDAHRRVAVSLVGAPDDLGRGAMLGRSDAWENTMRFTARIRAARYVDEVGEKGAFQVHVGSAAVPARLRTVGEGALVTLDHPLPLRYGDRFILRETGRRAVVGGGVVLDPQPPRRGKRLRRAAGLAPGLSPAEAADALLEVRGSERFSRLVAHAGAAPTRGVPTGDRVMTVDEMESLTGRAISHRRSLSTPTTPSGRVSPSPPWPVAWEPTPTSWRWLVTDSSDLDSDGTVVWRRGWAVVLDPAQEKAWAAAREMLAEAGLSAPASPTSRSTANSSTDWREAVTW